MEIKEPHAPGVNGRETPDVPDEPEVPLVPEEPSVPPPTINDAVIQVPVPAPFIF